jgi:hypothetical protein
VSAPCDIAAPRDVAALDTREPFASWTMWLSWMVNQELASVANIWGAIQDSSPLLASRTWSSLVPRSGWIAAGRQMQNIECGYKEIPEWHMLDDPMRSIARNLPTWENTVHPLCEMVLLPLTQWPVSSYLSCRLGAWLHDSYVSMASRDTNAQSMEAVVKPSQETLVQQAVMII